MKDYYLKFEDEAAAKAALVNSGFTTDEGGNVYHEQCAIDWVGVIFRTKDGEAAGAVDGYHVNVRAMIDDIEFPDECIVTPSSPVRVWV